MSVFFHGTSADNLQSILRYGIYTCESKIWTCSNDEVYLWSVDRLAEMEGNEEEETEYKEQMAFARAYESAQIACAAAKDCRCIVIRVELDENEVKPDCSCENMDNSGAVVLNRDVLLSEITDIKVSADLALLKGYFISLIAERDYCNIEFTPLELQIAKVFSSSELYLFEEMDSLAEWETVEQYESVVA